ncbi:hypothetical protein E3U55_09000 [Filobacillus milosensis]|uniref:Uncharacterized protein n=1 Tax=Filobacillus milosensis TaxID=94137 RepID=A0A4Y8IMJ6_9BACI|nr:hypothetical protein [Filobacillus milosensis]TFB21438.1 hypothetical protein E3U55_09000 [Filobacillus milosensis]
MKKNAIVYVKGFTNEVVEANLEPIKEYCYRNGLEIVEILSDETAYNEKDLDCIRTLYNYMSSKKVTAIIFTSCYPDVSIRKYIMQLGIFPDYETLNFDYGVLESRITNCAKGEETILNQATFDTELSVDFGNLVERLSKEQNDLRFINREENARLVEESKGRKQKAFRDFIKEKRILGIVFNEGNMSTMISYLGVESFMDNTGDTDAMVYSNYHDLETVLSSNNYYKVIFDGLGNGDLGDFRDLVLLCEQYAVEVQFCFGHLSSRGNYELIEILDELTENA